MAEHSIPRHQQLRTRSHNIPNCIHGNAAIHFNPEIQSALFAHARKFFHLLKRIFYELLSAEPWIHGHHQHVMHDSQNVRQRFHRRRWIQHHSRLAAVILDQVQRAVQVHTGFLVH